MWNGFSLFSCLPDRWILFLVGMVLLDMFTYILYRFVFLVLDERGLGSLVVYSIIRLCWGNGCYEFPLYSRLDGCRVFAILGW